MDMEMEMEMEMEMTNSVRRCGGGLSVTSTK
jgi:hypothetical protein